MHIISKKALQKFWEKHPNSESALRNWLNIAKKANWENFAEVRKDFSHADRVGNCIVFNIGGNNYRLITKIKYRAKIVYIRAVLTHKEYDKDEWKPDGNT